MARDDDPDQTSASGPASGQSGGAVGGAEQPSATTMRLSAVNPADLPTPQAVLKGSATSGATASEPIYRIVVELVSQRVNAYGQSLALQPGMTLEADVSLERRRLAEWVLEPLYAVTGKWH